MRAGEHYARVRTHIRAHAHAGISSIEKKPSLPVTCHLYITTQVESLESVVENKVELKV